MTTVEDFDKEVANEIVTLGDAERNERLAGEEMIRSVKGGPTAADGWERGRAGREQETEFGSDDESSVTNDEFRAGGYGGKPQ